jgi:hypothetical protein
MDSNEIILCLKYHLNVLSHPGLSSSSAFRFSRVDIHSDRSIELDNPIGNDQHSE